MRQGDWTMRKKSLLIGVAFSALIAAPAIAADLSRPVYRPPPPVVVPVWSWTGCYFGGHIGGLWATKDWSNVGPGFPIGSSAVMTPTAFSAAYKAAVIISSPAAS